MGATIGVIVVFVALAIGLAILVEKATAPHEPPWGAGPGGEDEDEFPE